MTEVSLIHGWVLTYQDNADIVVAVNQAENVAITYATKAFGEVQTLLFTITEDKIAILNLPFVFKNLTILSDKKEITFDVISIPG
ncbi:hypothetical protein [Aerococcus viridans]|uniref:hypothetical protein n=1 Tax=Aerococcus viridans TaxID=1377 RepID=UPI003B222CB7